MARLSQIQNLRQSLAFLGIWRSLRGETVRNLTEVLIPTDRACEVSVSEHSHCQGIRGLQSICFLLCINSCYQKVIISLGNLMFCQGFYIFLSMFHFPYFFSKIPQLFGEWLLKPETYRSNSSGNSALLHMHHVLIPGYFSKPTSKYSCKCVFSYRPYCK